MEHLKKYIGWYLAGFLVLALYYDDQNDKWLYWLSLAAVICLAPPFNLKDRFQNVLIRFFSFIFRPWHRFQATWPNWVRWVFAIVVFILFEEYFLRPMGQTMYPWRMDFSS